MKAPEVIVIDGRVYRWRAIVEARRQRLEAWRTTQGHQPALFELRGIHG